MNAQLPVNFSWPPSAQGRSNSIHLTRSRIFYISSLIFMLIACESIRAASSDLGVLKQQYEKATSERVTSVYESNLLQLNARYLEAVDRTLTAAKSAGNLAEALALTNEKKLIVDRGSVPDDDDSTKPSLKKLRAVYRGELQKLKTQRESAQAALLGPYATRLKELEVSLTQSGKLDEAKEVLDYRTALGSSMPSTSDPSSSKDFVTNSLGMKFVPVKGTAVFFCVHETRRKDYIAFTNDVPIADTAWKTFKVEGAAAGHEDTHPVVHVEWDDAKNFCEWLSKKEGKVYRLPTDKEWSYAEGNGAKERWMESTTPESLSGKENDYPWDKKYPPAASDLAGNYGDKTWFAKFPGNPYIEGYSDGFVSTAPVMSFKPNKLGLYDMGGNVSEWVEDWWNSEKIEHTLRGGGWQSAGKNVLSSARYTQSESGTRYYRSYGFRVVLERP